MSSSLHAESGAGLSFDLRDSTYFVQADAQRARERAFFLPSRRQASAARALPVEELSFCRERYTGRAAPQEVDADLILQVLDLSAQCRLRKGAQRLSEVQHFAAPPATEIIMPQKHGGEEGSIGRIASPLIRNN